ncbi:hypothetical protein SERLA73DRAFT_139892 [Serpula lacrymans var. lacrymans S7.3]|uniref:Uncharacterized protein n=1 Tax=Serpula lacrymans var. lacrymans (strain S7.3) TaxID=936435 RepID=F8Q332_SERL3|nr:hypothetical protein SERLA73DRAFT_139892 [Serpula lacrymans var. lacrymans S7.3]
MELSPHTSKITTALGSEFRTWSSRPSSTRCWFPDTFTVHYWYWLTFSTT